MSIEQFPGGGDNNGDDVSNQEVSGAYVADTASMSAGNAEAEVVNVDASEAGKIDSGTETLTAEQETFDTSNEVPIDGGGEMISEEESGNKAENDKLLESLREALRKSASESVPSSEDEKLVGGLAGLNGLVGAGIRTAGGYGERVISREKYRICERCVGKGRVWFGLRKCPICKGAGKVIDSVEKSVLSDPTLN